MATTTNFGWETPDDTDLVKDGAAAMRTLGNAIDASLVDLKGGTTGQVLSKASNTDLDYSWVTPELGDITAVTVSSPITGGGTTGSVNIAIQDGTTAQKGAVQLEDSTSSTSTTKAATPNSVKTAYDLANGAIAKSIVDAKADLISATADNTPARLAVGANNTVLIADSAESTGLRWGGGWTTWTPTYSNITVGNGTATARYQQIGKTVTFEYRLLLGSTSTIGSVPTVSLPVTANIGTGTFGVWIGDAGTTQYIGVCDMNTTTLYPAVQTSGGTYVGISYLSATVPMTWTTNDNLTIRGSYEAA